MDEFAAPVYNRVRQKLFDAEEMTQNPLDIPILSSTSTSSDRRLNEFANMLDSCIEVVTLVMAQIESIEKESEEVAMLTKLVMETPLPEPPMMMEPTLMESERASLKRRRRKCSVPGPSAWLPT